MDHLSGMDAVFLHAESAEQPMHVGCLNVLQLPDGYEGDFFEDVKAFMARRIHLAPLFTRKLALMPFDLSNPVWVEDEDIDLEHHVRHVTLPKPGSNRQLQQAIGRQHSMLLDRSRPLWEIVIIDGLKSGEVAMYAKLHHAGMDGKAGMAVAHAIFDLTSEGRQIKPPRQKLRRNRYQLGMAELATAALRNTGQQYIKLLRMMPEMLRAARRLVPDSIAPTNFPWTFDKLMELVSPRTPLNVAITNQRSFAGRTVPVAEIKEIAALSGASFNDVVMATVSGALRRYLSASEELPDRALTAAVPVSLRKEGDTSNNNQVGMLLMDLATNEPDSIERLLRIRASTEPRKNTMDQVRSAIPMDFPMFAAPWLVSGLSSLYGRSRIAEWMPPPANLVISNVPGPQFQLYFAGAKVLSYYPVSIVTHGMALNVTVSSYNGRLDYGLIACRKAVPDLNELGDHLLAEHLLLLEQVRQRAASTPAPQRGDDPDAEPAIESGANPTANRVLDTALDTAAHAVGAAVDAATSLAASALSGASSAVPSAALSAAPSATPLTMPLAMPVAVPDAVPGGMPGAVPDGTSPTMAKGPAAGGAVDPTSNAKRANASTRPAARSRRRASDPAQDQAPKQAAKQAAKQPPKPAPNRAPNQAPRQASSARNGGPASPGRGRPPNRSEH